MKYSDQSKINALSAEYPYLVDIPLGLLTCLKRDELKLALLLKTHLLPGAGIFKLRFVTSLNPVRTEVSACSHWSANKLEPSNVKYFLGGNWYLGWEQGGYWDLGYGQLSLNLYSMPSAVEHWGKNQASQIDLGNGDRDIFAEANVDEQVFDKFLSGLKRLGQEEFSVTFDRLIATSPGALLAQPFDFYGPIHSLGSVSVDFSTNIEFKTYELGGTSFQINISKPTILADGAAQAIAKLMGASETEAKLHLFKLSKDGLPFCETSDVPRLVEVFNVLSEFDFEPNVTIRYQ